MASQLANHGYTRDEVGAVLRAMPSGKGADGHASYVKRTIANAFTAATGQASNYPRSLSDRETEDTEDCESQILEQSVEVQHRRGDPGDELEQFIQWACHESRAIAMRSKQRGRWQTESFQFLRLLKGRKEFAKMNHADLAKSSVWEMTDFNEGEVLEVCASWAKIKTTANQNRLRDAAIWSKQRPVPNSAPFQSNEKFMRFLSIAYYLQRSCGPDDEVFLPCGLLGHELGVSRDTISSYRHIAIAEGFLFETGKATRYKATRFRVELAKFNAGVEVVH